MKTYVTFGRVHRHKIGDQVFDKDCVALIEGENYSECRAKAFELFGPRFCFIETEDHFDFDSLIYFHRGIIPVETN